MRKLLLTLLLTALPVVGFGQITQPYVFSPNTTILSSQVNANFDKFADALNRTGGTMTGTLTSQQITPSSNATYDLGLTGTRFRHAWFSGTLAAGATTLAGNLIFSSDNTYDIGASGTSRARDLFLGRNIAFQGILTGTGIGAHSIVGGGIGSQTLAIRNSTAGAANFSSVLVQGDNAATQAALQYLSDSYTSAGELQAAGGRLVSTGAGGLSISASNASAQLRFYVNSVETMRMVAGAMLMGDTSNANATLGLTINQSTADDEALSVKSSDVAHGVTDNTETDTFSVIRKASATEGGLSLQGYSEGNAGAKIHGVVTTVITTETGGSGGAIQLIADLKSGTGVTTLAADDNVVVFKNNVNATHIFKGNGDSYQDGTGWTAYDTHDDVSLLVALEKELTGKDKLIGSLEAVGYNKDVLEKERLVTLEGGKAFVNTSRVIMVLTGAARQNSAKMAELRAENALLREQLASVQKNQSLILAYLEGSTNAPRVANVKATSVGGNSPTVVEKDVISLFDVRSPGVVFSNLGLN